MKTPFPLEGGRVGDGGGEASDPSNAGADRPARFGAASGAQTSSEPAPPPSPTLPPSRGKGDDPLLNLDWITPRLAVGGGFPESAAEWLARRAGVSAIVDLRAEACDDEAVLKRHGMTLLHLPTEDHRAVSQAMLDDGVAFVGERLERGECVLVHCQEGVGRSALLALCVLVQQGLAPLDALATAKDARWQVSPNPAQFEAWAEWLRHHGHAAPSFAAFAAIAYSHLRPR